MASREKIAAILHQERSKLVQGILRGCEVKRLDSVGSMTYSIPFDMKIRLSVESTTPFNHLPDTEKQVLLSLADKIIAVASSGLGAVHTVNPNYMSNVIVTSTKPVKWASINSDDFDADITIRTEDPFCIPQGMNEAEKLALEEALKEVEKRMRPIPELKSQSSRYIRGRGIVKTVRCNKQLLSTLHRLRNSSIVIDNNNWVVVAIECFMPVREGDTIGLIVRNPRDDERLIKCDRHGWSRAIIDEHSRIECSVCVGNDDTYLQIEESSDD